MIRVLFIILAVVSMVLAFVLGISWLYLAAAGMLGIAAVILTIDTRKRLRRSAVAGSKPAPVAAVPPEDDLRSLGIMEIRPKGSSAKEEVVQESENDEAAAEVEPEPVAKPGPIVSEPSKSSSAPDLFASGDGGVATRRTTEVSQVGVVRKRARTKRIMVEGVAEGLQGDVVLSTLRGLRAAVDATTVVIVREERGPLGYNVEAIVSRNSFARSGGRFGASEPLAASTGSLAPLVLRCNGPDGFNAKRLGYYHEPIAIREVAFVPMTHGDSRYLLLADSMEDDVLGQPDALRMLKEFARLLQAVVLEPAPETHVAGDSLRPRREIIAEEMQAARQSDAPLALALVHLNQAEQLQEHERPATESAFAERLSTEAAGGRVERFGELTYGILDKRDADSVAEWASDLLDRFRSEQGEFKGGVSIGVAILGDRHDGPDELRADATAALRESYETGECIILE